MRIIIKCPESDSPPKGRIHLRGLSFRKSSNLLQFGGGPYISPVSHGLLLKQDGYGSIRHVGGSEIQFAIAVEVRCCDLVAAGS